MSEQSRRIEQRKLRKAVGADAMQLMAAMSGILNEDVKPALDRLTQRIVLLEETSARLAARLAQLEHWASGSEVVTAELLPSGHGPSAFDVDGQSRTGAEVV